ncbi:MAG: hypothetical protein ACXVQU_00505 [Actinomycetota bacterium]|jgi:hypothetical protein
MADPERYDYDDRRYRDPEGGSGLVGYAAIKYAAIVIIVLAILAFLAWYLIPAITGHS